MENQADKVLKRRQALGEEENQEAETSRGKNGALGSKHTGIIEDESLNATEDCDAIILSELYDTICHMTQSFSFFYW